MSTNGVTNEFRILRDYIEENCGISLGDDKTYLVESRLVKLMAENGCNDYAGFVRLAKSNPALQLRDKIVDAMTTNETLWFRDTHPFTILREKLLPPLAADLRSGKRLRVRIWSGASSTGQEPYSIAMTVNEFCRANPDIKPAQYEIVATDISPSALFIANAGRYDGIAISRGLPTDLRDRYFTLDGRTWVLDENLRRTVTFKRFNLQDSLAPLGRFDIVFLRYVAIYFSPAFKRDLFARIARATAGGGHLIVGAVESLRGFSDDFEPILHANGTYYRSKL
jgi:chemotaxis protein methyltransferase CheR